MRRTILGCACLAASACVTPTGKPYDERRVASLALGASASETLAALGKPWQATPLTSVQRPEACTGRSESWTFSYVLPGKMACTSTLSFDQSGKLCAKESSTTLPGEQCQGVK